MQKYDINMAKHFQVRHRWNSIWKRITMALASVVVFCTVYALILPAITLEPEYICGQESHLHTEACYQLPELTTLSSLICTSDALGVHNHTPECYDENGEPKCGIADFVLHTHNSDCYDANDELVCPLPEIKLHTHDETCWQQPHVHDEPCFIQQHGELLCTLEEGSLHTHLDTCYIQQQNLICTLPETESHTHTTEACYTETKTLLCTESEVEAHTHSDSCYTIETIQICSQEETEGHTHGDGCFAEDGSTICVLPEIASHTHTDACFQTTSNFTCTLTETTGHSHSDTCYSEPTSTLICTTEETDGHTHSDTCYETVSVVTCALEENIPHAHTDSCFVCTPVLQCAQPTGEDAVSVLNCEKKELILHTHESACFDQTGACVCGLLEISEHIHDYTCFVITQAQTAEPVLVCDYEEHEHTEVCIAQKETDNIITSDQLIAEGFYCGIAKHIHKPENGCFAEDGMFMCTMTEHEHTELCNLDPAKRDQTDPADDWTFWLESMPAPTGVAADDLLEVARLQLDYRQSADYYTVTEEEEILYYNRYAGWWASFYDEVPYGDWNAKLIAFCLSAADIPFPLAETPSDWLWDPELADYLLAEGELPFPADLVFLDNDRVGIVTAVDAEKGKLDVILEWNGKVREKTFALDKDVLALARIPGNEPVAEAIIVTENVQRVIDLIDTMPSYDEIFAQLDAYCEADDTEGEQAYLMRVGQQGQYAYACYQALTEEEQAQVSNIQKLMESSAIWSAVTLEEPVDGTVYYCGKTAHEHSETCYNTESALICGYSEEHTHVKACLVDPSAYEETTDEEASLEGQYVYHSPYNLKYQESSHDLDKFDVVTFVLIPEKDVGEDKGESWLPNIIDWNGRADANYIVAYCSDAMTSTSTTGATYATFTLDNARFTSEEQRRVLSGIIAHSYPFITAEEMQAQLKAAYANGEITEAKVLDCTESEYIAASQWAIWQTTLLAQSFTYADASVFEYTDQCLNPLTDVGLTDNTEINNTVKAIKNWLVQQIEPVELEVDSYDYQVTPTEYGLYDLAVTVTLNREVENGELAEYGLAIGRQSVELHKLEAGESKFTATLESLTSEELTQAQVVLTVGGEHMQAYFFDSNNHQDLISGNWEYYADDLSFEVGVDTIDISVTKKWTDDAEGHPDVTIQLFANGEICGDPVTLSETNSWTYCWQDMLKTDALGELINYTIQEELIDGYSSTIEKHGTDAVEEVQFWEAVDTVEPGGQYVLLSSFINEAGLQVSNGALTWSENDSRDTSTTVDLLSWNYVDLSDPGKTSPNAVWTTTAGENGGFYLQNNGNDMFLYGTGSIYLNAKKTEYFFLDGLLSIDSTGSQFFMDIYSDGYAGVKSDPTIVTVFIPYKLITEERPKGDINFVVTNTKIEGETTSLTVTKQWAGRPDGIYPAEAVVNLTQNGMTYGGQVHLSAENRWTYTWTGLPVLDSDEKAFVYSVEEVGNADYVATAELTEATDETGVSSYQVLLTNTWIPVKSTVRLEKVDFYNGETFLPGAKFDIYLASDTVGDPIPGANDVAGVLYDQTTVGDAGTVELSLPTDETYYLLETQAPEGYNLSGTAVGFTVTQRGTLVMLELVSGEDLAQTTDGAPAVLTVKNKPGYELPETGGMGTAVYYLGGAAVMGLPIFAGVCRHKKRRATGD